MAAEQPSSEDVEDELLAHLDANAEIPDSRSFASSLGVPHRDVEDVIKRLCAFRIVGSTDMTKEALVLTDEAKGYVARGSPEVQFVAAMPPKGAASKAALQEILGDVFDVGLKAAAKKQWIGFDKENEDLVTRRVKDTKDELQEQLKRLENGEVFDDKVMEGLKRRKLITKEKSIWYSLKKGPEFVVKRKTLATDVTRDHLKSGDWKDLEFKDYNYGAQGQPIAIGYSQPLLEVLEAIQNIFVEMGFSEMPTNMFVESSFWNFDALFQPQQHPARDSHDTFFLKAPATTPQLPDDYLEKVKQVHQSGGYGSKGYGYDWKRDEAEKNLLRTHTTAVSTRMLYKLAQENSFAPKRYYSIDRVFRNEAVDRTHLAEFHQIEGLICDYGLTLGDLIGVLEDFFSRLGMSKLRFKPAYNPYTEPSMEIFGYHEGLKKWMEIGNSGMFRPEVLLPMGLPEGVNVIAWGLSLERPTMILNGINNIRKLFGPKVNFKVIKNRPMCRLGCSKVDRSSAGGDMSCLS
ncbi:phenylalanine--tRNA ligase alpha subunit, cytoplasmic-like [Hordeum vulgare subsp. vulgare]|uniref:phenylalanine--tRNA ligase alpha subunit, cytoplasmic-like n=1 Tax=Hordeum vulgare subsp. vulgare TaxID=112509 RepID=UPI00029628A8|nr:phenylalanine--tRNA ligase alpha subunit, cytoplasmic-like [Hordeum vulgare subsp. vulgare]